ncbi:MAG: 30S ribosomal protein S4 [Methanobacteriota archaeon]|nr:MAG: 30S ribosomal protein S4 [Euryarchaeota archaeon]
MGDPRKLSKKYKRPKKLWEKDRIEEEKKLRTDYGLKNTREVWIARGELRRIRREARKSLALPPEERELLIRKVLKKLARLNILEEGSSVDDILSLNIRHILERRLQTQVVRRGLAKTMKQARQLITHGFIAVDGTRVTSPSFTVTKELEDKIGYYKDAKNVFKQVTQEESEEKAEKKEEKEQEQKEDAKGTEEAENKEEKKEETPVEKPVEAGTKEVKE